MKQSAKIPAIQCETHGSIICSLQVQEKCPYKSRLACIKCMLAYKSMDNFIDFNDLNSTESFLGSIKGIQGIKLNSILYKSYEQNLQQIDDLIQDLHLQVNQLRITLIEQLDTRKEYLQKTVELRVQYDAELTNLQNKIASVSQIDNYHKSKEWVELEDCLQQYVQLFYHPDNQEINVNLRALNSSIPKKRFNLQPILDFQASIALKLAEYTKEMTFYQYCENILDKSPFGNSLIAKINDNETKQMKLIFSGQRDGMNPAAFWKNCLDIAPTITICESKSGQVFGGYTPCKWINNNVHQPDASMTSFLFSVTREQIYPIKLKEYASFGKTDYGPSFGGGSDFHIATDFQSGYSNLGHSYDISQYQVADIATHLFGGKTPALKSIEVYLIE